jgi:hypothetical protein
MIKCEKGHPFSNVIHNECPACGRNAPPVADFDGETYDPALDGLRLTGQLRTVHDLMKDGNWHTLSDIETETGYPQGSISARLRDLRKPKFGEHNISKLRVGGGLFKYRLEVET